MAGALEAHSLIQSLHSRLLCWSPLMWSLLLRSPTCSAPSLRQAAPQQAGGFSSKTIRRRPRLPCCQASQGDEDWVGANVDTLRTVPLAAGALGVAGVLINRVASGIAPVVTASSSQSRADVLVIVLSAVLMLTGLQWLSLKPRVPVRVQLEGEEATFLDPALPPALVEELRWAWQALSSATRARSLVVFHRGRCVAQLGVSPEGAALGSAAPGPICQQAMQSGRGNYLANLVLFPGRVEFAGYLPFNAQAALVQPVGKEGVLVAASDTQRGFSSLDQAWVAALADKLEVAFESSGPGN